MANAMDLQEALSQIAEIRQQVARNEVFRGYRAWPVAFSGFVALATACVQAIWIPKPEEQLAAYFGIWIAAAFVSLAATAVALVLHFRRHVTELQREKTWLAVSQFFPAIVVGGLLLYVLAQHAPETLWMMPGLWQLLFGLGIMASYRLLPRSVFWVGVFYIAAGIVVLAWATGDDAFSPWAMGIPFGIGQLANAAILYWTLERNDGEKQIQE